MNGKMPGSETPGTQVLFPSYFQSPQIGGVLSILRVGDVQVMLPDQELQTLLDPSAWSVTLHVPSLRTVHVWTPMVCQPPGQVPWLWLNWT
ncbi:MAG: hypothetical protein WA194_01015, partial [Patescibacteria group bacterium]